ncbi:MAG: SDR family oxidoreductase [Acidimicrobiaceae bacterium]|nr:SDR family oxidoreductase [Acidimicrobiaceae bacterium]MXW76641.1 SDR family oxidoreductase [Acidimicrobiaceae bacterium]MYC42777.1 SDR family oxidoreductase [Acidimicrobiaceae bacterium]MYD08269.1 SDR family oxidoreductase [Acidimicrobiaceae bacterium]MYI58710.1 SDR family oxidoreductase [Acidimicrobiaceae bacterium]
MNRPVALVTGAARGIGAATVAHLVADGWSVVAVDICADVPTIEYSLASPDELAAVGTAGGGHVMTMNADVRSQVELEDAAEAAVEHFGRLDAAVAAAGVFKARTPLWEVSDTEWNTITDIDLTGVFQTARAAIPRILVSAEPRRGRFVAVSSSAGTIGLSKMAPYVAAKHGVIGLVKALAVDLAGTGITSNAVAPGSTRTAILEASAAAFDTDINEFAAHQRPLGRLVEPSEVAAAICWLCSADAAAVTGTVVPVDGGMTSTL